MPAWASRPPARRVPGRRSGGVAACHPPADEEEQEPNAPNESGRVTPRALVLEVVLAKSARHSAGPGVAACVYAR
jgi:hypothetical protein